MVFRISEIIKLPILGKSNKAKCRVNLNTLLGTNISPKNGILKMIFLFPRYDMLVPWRAILKESLQILFGLVIQWPLSKTFLLYGSSGDSVLTWRLLAFVKESAFQGGEKCKTNKSQQSSSQKELKIKRTTSSSAFLLDIILGSIYDMYIIIYIYDFQTWNPGCKHHPLFIGFPPLHVAWLFGGIKGAKVCWINGRPEGEMRKERKGPSEVATSYIYNIYIYIYAI